MKVLDTLDIIFLHAGQALCLHYLSLQDKKLTGNEKR